MVSADPTVSISPGNVQLWFEYVAGFEFSSISPETVIVNETSDISRTQISVYGWNFNSSYQYQLWLSSAIDLALFTVELEFVSMNELVFSLTEIGLQRNRELVPTLMVVGNSQMTQTSN